MSTPKSLAGVESLQKFFEAKPPLQLVFWLEERKMVHWFANFLMILVPVEKLEKEDLETILRIIAKLL